MCMCKCLCVSERVCVCVCGGGGGCINVTILTLNDREQSWPGPVKSYEHVYVHGVHTEEHQHHRLSRTQQMIMH